MISQLTTLGVGLGFRQPLRSQVFRHRSELDFLEIIADHYLDSTPEKEAELELLAQHFTLVPHGLNLSIGSAEGIDLDYVTRMARLIQKVDPPWWSEHLAFTRAGGIDIGQFSPLPYTRETMEVVCQNIRAVREQIDVPLIFENITYMVDLLWGDMSEAEFLAEILERSDCGLLLDITNLYINAINHGYDPQTFLDRLPLDRVVQLHFVGVERHNDLLIDSHAQPTPPKIWDLMEEVLARAPVKGVILERDMNLPPFEDLLKELAQARSIGRRYRRWA